MNDNLTSIITESAIEVGGKIVRRGIGKLSQEAKDLFKKRQSLKGFNPTDRIDLAELWKLINRRKVADITKYNKGRIAHAVKNGGSLKPLKKKLGICKNQMYALRDKQRNFTTNLGKIANVAEEFYIDLYSSRDNQNDNVRERSPEELDIPPVTKEEGKKALEAMQRGKLLVRITKP